MGGWTDDRNTQGGGKEGLQEKSCFCDSTEEQGGRADDITPFPSAAGGGQLKGPGVLINIQIYICPFPCSDPHISNEITATL